MMHGPPTKAESKAQSKRDKAANRKAQSKVIGKVNAPRKRDKVSLDKNDKLQMYGVAAERPRKAEQPGLTTQTVQEDEFVAALYGGVGPQIGPNGVPVTIVAQPALAVAAGGFAKWGAAVSQLYESYEFEVLEFYYRPLVSAFSAIGGQTGKIVMGFNYDATEALPLDVRDAEANDPHVDGMAYESLYLKLDPRRLNAIPKYTRTGAVPGSDVKLYDAGRMFFIATGMATGADVVNIGELRVRYRLRLRNPRIAPSAVQPNLGMRMYSNVTIQTITNNTPTAINTMQDLQGLMYPPAAAYGNGVQNDIGVTPLNTGVFLVGPYAYSLNWTLTINYSTGGTQLLIFFEYTRESGTVFTYGAVPYANTIAAGTTQCLTLASIIDGTVKTNGLTRLVSFRCMVIAYSAGVITSPGYSSNLQIGLVN